MLTLRTSPSTLPSRLSIDIYLDLDPCEPSFKETQWIKSKDVNVERLLDVFATADANVDDIWNICTDSTEH